MHLPKLSIPVVRLTFSSRVSCATKARARLTASVQSPVAVTFAMSRSHIINALAMHDAIKRLRAGPASGEVGPVSRPTAKGEPGD